MTRVWGKGGAGDLLAAYRQAVSKGKLPEPPDGLEVLLG